MQLKSLTYSEFDDQPLRWAIHGLCFGSINLIVSRNAVGKSRIASLIEGIAHKVFNIGNMMISEGLYDLVFDDNGQEIIYQIDVDKGRVKKEYYKYHDKEYLDRDANGNGRLWTQEIDGWLKLGVPLSEVVAKRRDREQYPFFTSLHEWADSTHLYQFHTELGRRALSASPSPTSDFALDPNNKDMVIEVFRRGEKEFADLYKNEILADMRLLNFFLDDIHIDHPSYIVPDPVANLFQCLRVKEDDIDDYIDQPQLSMGMFRCLSLLIQINYHALANTPQCLIIDDIGEGLDYERSCTLVKLLMDKAKASNTQLIMTTNDRFIMNAVPLEYWTVLERTKNGVKFYNLSNSAEIFRQFRFTGLSNFDFFSMNFMHKQKSTDA